MDRITPCLWFNGDIELALELWGSLFEVNVLATTLYNDAGPGTPRTLMTAEFELEGRRFLALNGGPGIPQTEAFSFSVDCTDQADVDRLWDGLLADGGTPSQCGWLKDRFGFSWQIVPEVLPRLLASPDRDTAERVIAAMMPMSKLIVADLEKAASPT